MSQSGLTILIGPPASGKSTYARNNFESSEIVSFDDLSGALGGAVTRGPTRLMTHREGRPYLGHIDPKHALQLAIFLRCCRGERSVVDATNLSQDDRLRWIDMARDFGLSIEAVIMLTPEEVIMRRDAVRTDPHDPFILHTCYTKLQRTLDCILSEGFDKVTYVPCMLPYGDTMIGSKLTQGSM